MIESPLNYTGGKYKLLEQILPLFPKSIKTFYDIFCGGCNVGINIKADKIVFNDVNRELIGLFNTLKRNSFQKTFRTITEIIEKYNLSRVDIYGYEKYECNSAEGLSKYNKEHFMLLRKDFNSSSLKDDYHYYMLYVLIVYSFNNQIRFNSKGEFNLPSGKRDFNVSMQKKLKLFVEALKQKNISFRSSDFMKLNSSKMIDGDFIYADPPYLITCATYNESDGWNVNKEKQLLKYLDKANENGIKFALSNVLKNKGKVNEILIEWVTKNSDKYRVIHLNSDYSNSNYQTKDKTTKPDEVLIVNF